MEVKYRKALNVCSANLAHQDGSDPIAAALWFFRLGMALSRMGQLSDGIRCFNDAFLLRGGDDLKDDPKWPDFHNVQMGRYILSKKHKWIATLAEGDMIHDFIKDHYLELQEEIASSPFGFDEDNQREWCMCIPLDFPWYLLQ